MAYQSFYSCGTSATLRTFSARKKFYSIGPWYVDGPISHSTHLHKLLKVLNDDASRQLERLVDEGLAVLVELVHLDGVEQLAVAVDLVITGVFFNARTGNILKEAKKNSCDL